MSSYNILSKENSLVLRGLAIIAIMLHNFLHNPQLGLSQENEMAFSQKKALYFFNLVANGDCNISELFSFLGWTGVVIFVFLTGYGVAKNPPNPSETFFYIRRQWLKLLILLLPAMMVFMVGDMMSHDMIPTIFKRLIYLTMMANVVYPWVKCPPGVYWYFGLTFQFYLIYAFCGRYLNGKNLVIWSILTIVGLGLLCSLHWPELLSVYKHCITGWFVIFAMGVWMGKQSSIQVTTNHSIVIDILLLFLTTALVIVMNKWMLTWLLVPVIALVMYFLCGLLIVRLNVVRQLLVWIGRLSACIFVCHPIARFVINKAMLTHVDNLLFVVLIYVITTLFLAVLYNQLYKKLLLIMNIKK